MPLYLDVHNKIDGLTGDAVKDAHEAPSKEAAAAVHREAHGLLADEIIEVKEGS